ncbi:MAG: 50S ribosomal protein L34e [Promethearchaeota archaeon]|nr:MAG: 50S ribosomal protein L34e [Candidatus Lokiarchaeota archaeon]
MPRPGLRSKSQKRKKIRTPGNRNTTHYWRKRPSKAHCAVCKRPLQSIPRLRPVEMKKTNITSRRATRPESARYCHKCLQSIIQEKVRNF